MLNTPTPKRQNPGQFNSVQLNVVTVVDLHKAVATKTLKDTIYMIDNSVGGEGQGTAHLQTVCKQGQIINWLIYCVDMEKKPDGAWPPMPKINNIVFLDHCSENVSESKVCIDFKIYGGPDMIRSSSPLTPVYYYWAGMVLNDLPPGVYNYRFVLELGQEDTDEKLYLNTVEKPSLRVLKV